MGSIFSLCLGCGFDMTQEMHEQHSIVEQLLAELKRTYYAGQRPTYAQLKLIAPALSLPDYKLLVQRFMEYMREQELQMFKDQEQQLSQTYPCIPEFSMEDLLYFEQGVFSQFTRFLVQRDQSIAQSVAQDMEQQRKQMIFLTSENALLKRENHKLQVQIDALESSLSRLDESYQFECKAHQQAVVELNKLRETEGAGRLFVKLLKQHLDSPEIAKLSKRLSHSTADALISLLKHSEDETKSESLDDAAQTQAQVQAEFEALLEAPVVDNTKIKHKSAHSSFAASLDASSASAELAEPSSSLATLNTASSSFAEALDKGLSPTLSHQSYGSNIGAGAAGAAGDRGVLSDVASLSSAINSENGFHKNFFMESELAKYRHLKFDDLVSLQQPQGSSGSLNNAPKSQPTSEQFSALSEKSELNLDAIQPAMPFSPEAFSGEQLGMDSSQDDDVAERSESDDKAADDASLDAEGEVDAISPIEPVATVEDDNDSEAVKDTEQLTALTNAAQRLSQIKSENQDLTDNEEAIKEALAAIVSNEPLVDEEDAAAEVKSAAADEVAAHQAELDSAALDDEGFDESALDEAVSAMELEEPSLSQSKDAEPQQLGSDRSDLEDDDSATADESEDALEDTAGSEEATKAAQRAKLQQAFAAMDNLSQASSAAQVLAALRANPLSSLVTLTPRPSHNELDQSMQEASKLGNGAPHDLSDPLEHKIDELAALRDSLFDGKDSEDVTSMEIESLVSEALKQQIFSASEEGMCRRLVIKLMFLGRESVYSQDAFASSEEILKAIPNVEQRFFAQAALAWKEQSSDVLDAEPEGNTLDETKASESADKSEKTENNSKDSSESDGDDDPEPPSGGGKPVEFELAANEELDSSGTHIAVEFSMQDDGAKNELSAPEPDAAANTSSVESETAEAEPEDVEGKPESKDAFAAEDIEGEAESAGTEAEDVSESAASGSESGLKLNVEDEDNSARTADHAPSPTEQGGISVANTPLDLAALAVSWGKMNMPASKSAASTPTPVVPKATSEAAGRSQALSWLEAAGLVKPLGNSGLADVQPTHAAASLLAAATQAVTTTTTNTTATNTAATTTTTPADGVEPAPVEAEANAETKVEAESKVEAPATPELVNTVVQSEIQYAVSVDPDAPESVEGVELKAKVEESSEISSATAISTTPQASAPIDLAMPEDFGLSADEIAAKLAIPIQSQSQPGSLASASTGTEALNDATLAQTGINGLESTSAGAAFANGVDTSHPSVGGSDAASSEVAVSGLAQVQAVLQNLNEHNLKPAKVINNAPRSLVRDESTLVKEINSPSGDDSIAAVAAATAKLASIAPLLNESRQELKQNNNDITFSFNQQEGNNVLHVGSLKGQHEEQAASELAKVAQDVLKVASELDAKSKETKIIPSSIFDQAFEKTTTQANVAAAALKASVSSEEDDGDAFVSGNTRSADQPLESYQVTADAESAMAQVPAQVRPYQLEQSTQNAGSHGSIALGNDLSTLSESVHDASCGSQSAVSELAAKAQLAQALPGLDPNGLEHTRLGGSDFSAVNIASSSQVLSGSKISDVSKLNPSASGDMHSGIKWLNPDGSSAAELERAEVLSQGFAGIFKEREAKSGLELNNPAGSGVTGILSSHSSSGSSSSSTASSPSSGSFALAPDHKLATPSSDGNSTAGLDSEFDEGFVAGAFTIQDEPQPQPPVIYSSTQERTPLPSDHAHNIETDNTKIVLNADESTVSLLEQSHVAEVNVADVNVVLSNAYTQLEDHGSTKITYTEPVLSEFKAEQALESSEQTESEKSDQDSFEIEVSVDAQPDANGAGADKLAAHQGANMESSEQSSQTQADAAELKEGSNTQAQEPTSEGKDPNFTLAAEESDSEETAPVDVESESAKSADTSSSEKVDAALAQSVNQDAEQSSLNAASKLEAEPALSSENAESEIETESETDAEAKGDAYPINNAEVWTGKQLDARQKLTPDEVVTFKKLYAEVKEVYQQKEQELKALMSRLGGSSVATVDPKALYLEALREVEAQRQDTVTDRLKAALSEQAEADCFPALAVLEQGHSQSTAVATQVPTQTLSSKLDTVISNLQAPLAVVSPVSAPRTQPASAPEAPTPAAETTPTASDPAEQVKTTVSQDLSAKSVDNELKDAQAESFTGEDQLKLLDSEQLEPADDTHHLQLAKSQEAASDMASGSSSLTQDQSHGAPELSLKDEAEAKASNTVQWFTVAPNYEVKSSEVIPLEPKSSKDANAAESQPRGLGEADAEGESKLSEQDEQKDESKLSDERDESDDIVAFRSDNDELTFLHVFNEQEEMEPILSEVTFSLDANSQVPEDSGEHVSESDDAMFSLLPDDADKSFKVDTPLPEPKPHIKWQTREAKEREDYNPHSFTFDPKPHPKADLESGAKVKPHVDTLVSGLESRLGSVSGQSSTQTTSLDPYVQAHSHANSQATGHSVNPGTEKTAQGTAQGASPSVTQLPPQAPKDHNGVQIQSGVTDSSRQTASAPAPSASRANPATSPSPASLTSGQRPGVARSGSGFTSTDHSNITARPRTVPQFDFAEHGAGFNLNLPSKPSKPVHTPIKWQEHSYDPS